VVQLLGAGHPFDEKGGLNPKWSLDGKIISYTTWKGGLLVTNLDQNLRQTSTRTLLPNATDDKLDKYIDQGGSFLGYFATPKMESQWS
jgi:hypothetical protein